MLRFVYIDICHFNNIIISDRCLKNIFFCYLVTVVVRFFYIDIATVTLKDILILGTDVSKKTFLLMSQCHL